MGCCAYFVLYCTCEHTGSNNDNYKTITSSTENFLWVCSRCLQLYAGESLSTSTTRVPGEVASRLCCGDCPGLLHGSERVRAAASDCRTPALPGPGATVGPGGRLGSAG